jgi:predicted CXXCH cytochrome family protein
MRQFNLYKKALFIFLVLFLISGWFCGAWGKHERIACVTCHDKTENELKEYVYDKSDFPASALCLSCHDGDMEVSGLGTPHVVNGKRELAGGSFTSTLVSDKVGHNILSSDMKLGLTPPGGPSLSEFGCLSCHDAHENGNYRSLKKEINGYTTLVEADGDPEFKQNVYISGINNFCGACHLKFNGAGSGGGMRGRRSHPVGLTIAGAEHADVEHWLGLTGKVTQAEHPSGDPNNPYDAEVFCLTCHRAHATPFNNAMRWDYSKTAQGCLECHTF